MDGRMDGWTERTGRVDGRMKRNEIHLFLCIVTVVLLVFDHPRLSRRPVEEEEGEGEGVKRSRSWDWMCVCVRVRVRGAWIAEDYVLGT